MLIPLFLTFFINNSHARELYQLGNLSWIPRRNEFVHAFQYSKVNGKKKMVDALFMSNTNKVEATDYRWKLQYGLTNRLRIGLLQNGSFSSLSNDENGNKTSSNGHNTPQLMTFYRVLEQYPAFINIDLFFKYTPDFGKAQLGTRSHYKSGGEI